MVEGIRLVKFQKKIKDTTSQKNPTSLIKKTACNFVFSLRTPVIVATATVRLSLHVDMVCIRSYNAVFIYVFKG